MGNPFYFRELPLSAVFCNRQKEIKDLVSHALNSANVVLSSPRRYGKTSLVKRVQEELAGTGTVRVYVDFFGITSTEDIASRMAARLYAFCYVDESLFKKAMRFLSFWRPVIRPEPEYGLSISVEATAKKPGLELLEELLEGLGRFMADHDKKFHIFLDEFQEISELGESLQIEGIMRSHIQRHNQASYFFVGSRRRILMEIFNERKRPFYQSAINYNLPPLPLEECVSFIIDQFKSGGKICPEPIARRVAEKLNGYAYYVQRIPYCIFEVSGDEITDDDYMEGFALAMSEERPFYEAMLRALTPNQINLLAAVAAEPTDKPYSARYMAKHQFGSVGGVQVGLKKLLDQDYIQEHKGVFEVVDPVFSIWLRHFRFRGIEQ